MQKISTIIVSIMLSACAAISSPPAPVKSEYFTTMGGGFITTIGKSPIQQYGVNLILIKDFPENSYAVIEFQNPANATQPLVTESSIEEIKNASSSKYKDIFVLKSPPVFGITQNTNYQVSVSIYSDSTKTHLITTHKQLVNSGYIEN